MINILRVEPKQGEVDTLGEKVKKDIENFLKIKINSVKTRKVYVIDAELTQKELELLKKDLFVDPITEILSEDGDFDWSIEVGYKSGVTDNIGNTIKNTAIPNILKRKLKDHEGVYTAKQYLINGELTRDDIENIGAKLLANPIIETIRITGCGEKIEFEPPIMRAKDEVRIREYDLNVSDDELMEISRKGILSLSLEEMKAIRNYYKDPDIIDERKRIGMEERFWDKPTDAELEAIAQTWSEHCKHKIFNAVIEYHNLENDITETIDSLFNTYIKNPSREIGKKYGWVISSFDDNAGVVKFNERLYIVDKIETHNAPSALEPYGGAITGIVGVDRDIMGTGKGARPIAHIFGYCFADPFIEYDKLPEGVLHPRRIRDGVHKGVIDGGNQSGIPLVRGWEFFDDRFIRPLVYCGTIGVMPVAINNESSHIKKADPGDLIVMVGGRIGKDGIHGATFSSAELDKESPVQAVQIGDPIMQKKMSDFLIEARDKYLIKIITDNGAGGLSSSVGETARFSNGCEIDLEKAPLKYKGLDPWEILLSEAQERMTVGIDPSKINEFLELARMRDVEATVLGKYTDTGKFHVKYGEQTVAYLDLDFLHNGLPRKRLKAVWKKYVHEEPDFDQPELNKTLEQMLSRLNTCSKENKLRQYDHEVKGLSVIKPLVGIGHDVPCDASVMLIENDSKEGLIISEGVNPHYSDIDTYHMATSAADIALRRIIAAGGKLPSKATPFYALDNYCWNISDEYNEDGQYKLAQLKRANEGLENYYSAFGFPLISGKDSMKNVWKMKDERGYEKLISISPTLLVSLRAKIDNVGKAVTMDVKRPGDLVYIIGETFDELGGSEYFHYIGEEMNKECIGNNVPKVNFEKAKKLYQSMSRATEKEIIHSAHTPTVGGLGVAFALKSFAGGYGIDIDISKVPYSGKERDDYILFSESNSRFIVTISEENKEEFEKIMQGNSYAHIGYVTEEKRLRIRGLKEKYVIDSDINELKKIWKKTLGDL